MEGKFNGEEQKRIYKKVTIILVMVIYLEIGFILLSSYMVGLDTQEEKVLQSKQSELIQKQESISQLTGWAESNWMDIDDSPWVVNVSIPLNINHTNLTSITFKIEIKDSDVKHAESDMGSDPDAYYFIVEGDNTILEERQGVTPVSFMIEIKSENLDSNVSYLPQGWNFQINADCYGKSPKSPFDKEIYEDQGITYIIDGEYYYMVEVSKIKETTLKHDESQTIFPILMLLYFLIIMIPLLFYFGLKIRRNQSQQNPMSISCPICSYSFQVIKKGKPIRVQCPNCAFQVKFGY